MPTFRSWVRKASSLLTAVEAPAVAALPRASAMRAEPSAVVARVESRCESIVAFLSPGRWRERVERHAPASKDSQRLLGDFLAASLGGPANWAFGELGPRHRVISAAPGDQFGV